MLVHYDLDAKPTLNDASPYRVDAVLSHQFNDGIEKPITFVSETLASAEHHYAHLNKETLAILFRLKHFKQYLAGRQYVIYSDHKPLMYLLSATKPTPTSASAGYLR